MLGMQSLDVVTSRALNSFSTQTAGQCGPSVTNSLSGLIPSLHKDDKLIGAADVGMTELSTLPHTSTANLSTLGSSAYPGAVLQGRRLTHTTSLPANSTQLLAPFSSDNTRTLQHFTSFPATTAQLGPLPTFNTQPAPLPSLYASASLANASNPSAGLPSLPESFSCASGLSCATAKPQLSGDCQSTNNSEDSILHSINSSPCYQSSYSGSYLSNSFQGPASPVSRVFDNAALLEQTAAMMKSAAAALQNLQSSSPLYHTQPQQLPTDRRTSAPLHQYPQQCFAPQYSNAVQSTSFLPIQTAPSMPCIGMQALEELMMSDSSVDSSPIPALATSPSAPARLLTIPQPASPCSSPAKIQTKRESKASALQHAKPAARAVTDIPVFDCKAAAAAAAQHAQQAAQAEADYAQQAQQAAQIEADFAQQAQQSADDLADFDLPLIDDCFLDSVGSGMGADLDSDLTSGLCFDATYFEQSPFEVPFDRSDSSDNLAEQALVAKPTVTKRKPKQSKKLKARGGITKSFVQMLRT